MPEVTANQVESPEENTITVVSRGGVVADVLSRVKSRVVILDMDDMKDSEIEQVYQNASDSGQTSLL